MNMFAVNLGRLREDFLRKTPIVKTATFWRRLPDTLAIEITERTTLARLGAAQFWGVDREGRIFSLRSGTRDLPVITGYTGRRLEPGGTLDASALPALEVLDTCARTPLGDQIRIASLDVSNRDRVELYLASGTRVPLAWPGMGTGTPAERQRLEDKLRVLVQAQQAAESRGHRLSNLDLTFHDQYVPAQEY